MSVSTQDLHVRNLFAQAARLNQNGVECLMANHYEGAYRSFQAALEVTAALHRELDSACGAQSSEAEATPVVWPLAGAIPVAGSLCYYVYDHPLLFAPPSTPTKTSVALCSSVILFNIALAFHAIGEHGLAMASDLYEKVAQLSQAFTNGSARQQGIHLLQVIAQNNHTQVLIATGHVKKAKKGVKDLVGLLAHLAQDGGEEPSQVVDIEVLQEMCLNTLAHGIVVNAPAA